MSDKKKWEDYIQMCIDDAIEAGLSLDEHISEHIRNFALLMESDYRARGLSGNQLYTDLLNDPMECIDRAQDVLNRIKREVKAKPVMSQAEHDKIGCMWIGVGFIAMHGATHHMDTAVNKLTLVKLKHN